MAIPEQIVPEVMTRKGCFRFAAGRYELILKR